MQYLAEAHDYDGENSEEKAHVLQVKINIKWKNCIIQSNFICTKTIIFYSALNKKVKK